MAKKRAKHTAISRRSAAQKKADEKLFLKLLQDYDRKQTRKTPPTKIRTSNVQSDSGENKKRKADKSAGNKRGKKSVQKTVPVHKTKTAKKSGKVGVKTTADRTTKTQSGKLVTEKRIRGKEQTDFHFSGVRSVDKKINLFKSQADKAIKNQLKRNGGKPPKGIIVTVYDKKDREHTRISPLDFVVNADSVQGFVNDMLGDMKDDFLEWKDMEDEPGDDTDSNPYADFNPDNIASITIKYIY